MLALIHLLALLTPLVGSLFGESSKSQGTIEWLSIEVKELRRALENQKNDLTLITDQLASFTSSLDHSKKELSQTSRAESESARERLNSLDKRIVSLESNQKSLLADLKTLKDHVTTSETALTSASDRLATLEKTVTSDMKNLKSSLETMMALLQKESGATSSLYIVQSGDSLGKIAEKHHTTIRKIKELNSLSSDQIRPGQKLTLPN